MNKLFLIEILLVAVTLGISVVSATAINDNSPCEVSIIEQPDMNNIEHINIEKENNHQENKVIDPKSNVTSPKEMILVLISNIDM